MEAVATGGLVCLHDSRSTAARDISTAGSVRTTNEIVLKDPEFELLEQIDSLTVVRKRATNSRQPQPSG